MSIWNKFKSKFESMGTRARAPRFSVTKKDDTKDHAEVKEKKRSIPVDEGKNTREKVIPASGGTVSTAPGSTALHTHIIRKPLLTEKATAAQADLPRRVKAGNKHVFEVAVYASKYEIKKAIRETYGVSPTKVQVLNFEGKATRWGRRVGSQRDWRKAYVTLPKGVSIETHKGADKKL